MNGLVKFTPTIWRGLLSGNGNPLRRIKEMVLSVGNKTNYVVYSEKDADAIGLIYNFKV